MKENASPSRAAWFAGASIMAATIAASCQLSLKGSFTGDGAEAIEEPDAGEFLDVAPDRADGGDEEQPPEQADIPGDLLDVPEQDVSDRDGVDGIPEAPEEDEEEEVDRFRCRRSIDIDNSANAQVLSGFQMLLDIPHAAGMNPDFSDLRFTDASGTRLAYWMESWSDGSAAKVWVRIPSIPASGHTTIFMLFGNPAATHEGNIESVFDFCDSFESGDLAKWTLLTPSRPWSVTDTMGCSGTHSALVQSISGDSVIIATGLDMQDVAFDAWWRLDDIDVDIAQLVRSTTSYLMREYETNLVGTDGWNIAKMTDDWHEIAGPRGTMYENSWTKVTVVIVGRFMQVLVNDAQVNPGSGWQDVGTEMSGGSVGFRGWSIPGGATWWVDDARVRKAANPAPTYSFGTDECL